VQDEYNSMSERDRQMANQIGERAGQVVVARLLDAVQDREIAERVIDTYAGEAQRIVGRAFFRFAFWVIGVVLLVAAWKTGVLAWVNDFFEGHK
jgi:hypothetical protein